MRIMCINNMSYEENIALETSGRALWRRLLCQKAAEEIWSFFHLQSSPYPPALSNEESLNSYTTFNLLVYFIEVGKISTTSVDEDLVALNIYDFIVILGGVLIHSLVGTTGKAFDSYYNQMFFPRVRHELQRSTRTDTVRDPYRALTKEAHEKKQQPQRESGTAKIAGNAKFAGIH